MKKARLLAASSGGITFQGKDCKHGHGGLRYVSSAGCVECNKLNTVQFRLKLERLRQGLDENGDERLP